MDWIDEVQSALERWRSLVVGIRADAASRRLIELLPSYPVVSVAVAARELEVWVTSARTALESRPDMES